MPRPPVRLLALLAAMLLATSGCATVQDTVDDARDRVDDVRENVAEGLQTLRWCTAAFRLGAAVARQDIEAGRSAAEDLRADAPPELADELDLILAAVDAAENGDPSSLQSDEVRAAGEAVLAEAETRCDPVTRPSEDG